MTDTLRNHLATGSTTVARAWAVSRRDGVTLGFTDHDLPLTFEGMRFEPDAGLTARAFAQTTGLSVDNSEAVGALCSEAIREDDIAAGRYDGADVRVWLVNWADCRERRMLFAGKMGEVVRSEGAFTTELRGLSEALNREQGRIYHPRCSALLGDDACRADLAVPGMTAEVAIADVEGTSFGFEDLGGFDDGWFAHGRLEVMDGPAAGLWSLIRADKMLLGGRHEIELWQAIPAPIAAGTRVKLWPGCDRNAETCRLKFHNFVNFRGFPHIPGEDWLMAVPARQAQGVEKPSLPPTVPSGASAGRAP